MLFIHFKELMKILLTRKQQHHVDLEFILKCVKNHELKYYFQKKFSVIFFKSIEILNFHDRSAKSY